MPSKDITVRSFAKHREALVILSAAQVCGDQSRKPVESVSNRLQGYLLQSKAGNGLRRERLLGALIMACISCCCGEG